MTRPRMCPSCGRKPVSTYSAKYCFDCRPVHRRPPPPCRRCGSLDYYSAGLCQRCHPYAPELPTSCPDCRAWGLLRRYGGRCIACRAWRKLNPCEADCWVCGQLAHVNEDGTCRLCVNQAKLRRKGHKGLSLHEANRDGQQLFLADLERRIQLRLPRQVQPVVDANRRPLHQALAHPPVYRQLALLDFPRDMKNGLRRGFPPPVDEDLAAAVEAVVVDHGSRNGWNRDKQYSTRRALRVLLGLQDTPGARIKASAAAALYDVELPVEPTLEILAVVGLLDDDRVPAVTRWFERQVATLPAQTTRELRVWFEVMRHGSATPPRFRLRPEGTIRHQLASAMPALRRWAADHESLRAISKQDVLDVLPASGTPRVEQLQGIRSIFRIFKARKLVFTNPTFADGIEA